MSKSTVSSLPLRLSVVLVLCGALFTGLIGPRFGLQSASASTLYVVASNSLQVPAGGTAYLQVRGISMQAGAAIPAEPFSLAAQQPVAGDRLRTTVYYGIDWGYSETAPHQVALALWWAQDGTWHSTDHVTAERIAGAAAGAQGIPSWNPDGRNVLTALSQGQAGLGELTLTPLDQTGAVGSGTLAVSNTSGSDMTVYLPYGTVFTGASGSVMVWANGVGGAPQEATPAVEPTQPAATETATVVLPSSTPVPPQATATTQTYKVPPASATPTAIEATPTETILNNTAKGATATATATTAPATNTPAPTDTPQATSTPVPTDTPRPPDTATALPQPPSVKQQPGTGTGTGTGMGAGTQDGQQAAPQLPTTIVEQKPNPPAEEAGAAQQQPSKSPDDTEQGPLPITAQPTFGSAATPTVTRANGNSEAVPPPPVNTSTSQQNGAPPAVGTAGSQPVVPPNPAQTSQAALTPGAGETAPTRPPAQPPASVPTASGEKVPSATDTPVVANPEDIKPPEEKPTPTPEAVPVPPPAAEVPPPSDGGPVIVVGPGGTDTGTVPSPAGGADASGNPAGSPPQQNPNTGGGQSGMPYLLSAAALLMLLGGWALRRVSRTAIPVRTQDEQ
ncbi:MAG: hypothetical protein ABI670_07975 [Chloroflexota bacterium]